MGLIWKMRRAYTHKKKKLIVTAYIAMFFVDTVCDMMDIEWNNSSQEEWISNILIVDINLMRKR